MGPASAQLRLERWPKPSTEVLVHLINQRTIYEGWYGSFWIGWAWLVTEGGKLQIGSTANQDNPLWIK